MNKELKEHAHKEFDDTFINEVWKILKLPNVNDLRKQQRILELYRKSTDSIIDKTVLSEQDRIVGIIENAQDNYLDINSYETYAELESLKSLITNKSYLNKDKE